MSDNSLCGKMDNVNLAISNETDGDVSDSILDDDDNNNIEKNVDNIIDAVNNIDDGQQYKNKTVALLQWILKEIQGKTKRIIQEAINLHLKGEGELYLIVNWM